MSTMDISLKAQNEIRHGLILSMGDTESIWGWGSVAGQMRAGRRADLIARGAGLGPGVRALEIGCGTGMFTEKFARTGAQIVAVDISSDLLERARARKLPADRIVFLEKRFEECCLDGPFDAVIGSSVLHHLDMEKALGVIRRLLRPGGMMSFAEPNMLNPQVFIERKLKFLHSVFWYVSEDETAFYRHELEAMLKDNGFEDIRITPFDWLHPSTPEALIGPVESLGRLLEKTPLLKELAGSLYIQCRRSAKL